LQAFCTWYSLLQKYRTADLLPSTVCAAIEDAALALPDMASGEPPSIFQDLQDAAGVTLNNAISHTTNNF
jgi:hypothetical protein